MSPDGIKEITTRDVFAGKKVVLFAVPGAFTPTCISSICPASSRAPTSSSGWASTRWPASR